MKVEEAYYEYVCFMRLVDRIMPSAHLLSEGKCVPAEVQKS